METIKVQIGTVQGTSSGTHVQDDMRDVEFKGEQLASYSKLGTSDKTGGPTDTRGINETLYRTDDGRLVVHIENWSNWQGEPTTHSLREVTQDDLEPNGDFELLGLEAGMGRALTLEEALT